MEIKICSCSVTFMNFANFDVAKFVGDSIGDCILTRDRGESWYEGQSVMLAQQAFPGKRTAAFPKFQLLLELPF